MALNAFQDASSVSEKVWVCSVVGYRCGISQKIVDESVQNWL